jgi:hypothetical protein
MSPVLSLALAALFPFALLAMMLWLARLEDNLPADIRRTRRTPDPEPILRIPVREPLPQPLLHQGLLVDAVLEAHPEPAVPEQPVPVPDRRRPVVPLDLDVPPQRTPDDQVPTRTR